MLVNEFVEIVLSVDDDRGGVAGRRMVVVEGVGGQRLQERVGLRTAGGARVGPDGRLVLVVQLFRARSGVREAAVVAVDLLTPAVHSVYLTTKFNVIRSKVTNHLYHRIL